MNVSIITGASGAGKSTRLYETIIENSIREPEVHHLLIVPEQYTMEAQRQLALMHPKGGYVNIDAIGFDRLAYRVFDELRIGTGQVLEEFGKSMVVKKIMYENRKKLEVYGSYYDRFGFIDEMKSMMSELFQYGIKEPELDELISRVEPTSPVYAKLKDIKLIYDEFKRFTGERYIVAEELAELLTAHAGQSELITNSYIYFDAFTGFTPVQLELIGELMSHSLGLTFAFAMDHRFANLRSIKDYELFCITKTNISKIMNIAKEKGATVESDFDAPLSEINPRFKDNEELSFLERNLFRFANEVYDKEPENVVIAATADTKSEAAYVATQIRRLVREENYRYRDIAIVVGDLQDSAAIYERVMEEYDIPVFIDATTSLKSNPCSETIRGLLDMLAHDFTYDSVFRFLKAGMTDLESSEIETLENYALRYGIRGFKRWNRTVPEKYAERSLHSVEDIREAFVQGVAPAREALTAKDATVKTQLEALYDLLVAKGVPTKLDARGEVLALEGLHDEALAYSQIFEKTVRLFDKIIELIGDMTMPIAELYELIDTGLSGIEIGTVPPTVDRVMVGDLTRSRLTDVKVLFFTSVNDGIVPKTPKKGKILSDRDRAALEGCGVELAPSGKQNTFIEQFYIYSAITKPSDKLFVTYHTLDKKLAACGSSYLVSRIEAMYPELKIKNETAPKSEPDTMEDVLRLASRESSAELRSFLDANGYDRELTAIIDGENYDNNPKPLDGELVDLLYGRDMRTSVSKLELYSRCSYAFFLRYGLGLREREISNLDVRDLGNILHAVMEKVFKKVRDTKYNDWSSVQDDERDAIVAVEVDKAAAEQLGDFFEDSSRNKYMLTLIHSMARRTAKTLHKHILVGSMKPTMIEKMFDTSLDDLKDYIFDLKDGHSMTIAGKIDRVDTAVEDDELYIKVVDYKSSAKNVTLEEIRCGIKLQLVTYSAMAYELQKKLYPDKNIHPAGMLYYSFDDPLVEKNWDPCKEDESGEVASAMEYEHMNALRMRGVVQSSVDVIKRMDETVNTSLNIEYDSKGKLKGKSIVMLSEEGLCDLMNAARDNIDRIGNEIISGEISIAPLRNSGACDYCDFKSICRFDTKCGDNEYKLPNKTIMEKYIGASQDEHKLD